MKEVHIRKRELQSGVMYEYRFEIASQGGKRKFITKGGFRTKTEAKEAGKKAQQEYENNGQERINEDLSVADLIQVWFAQSDIKTTTKMRYESIIRTHIIPAIGAYRAITVTDSIIQTEIVDKLYNQGYSRSLIINATGIVRHSFEYGRKNLNIPRKIGSMTLPKNKPPITPSRKNPHMYISKEQFKKIIELYPEGTGAYLPLLLGYSCGFRQSEVLALTWDDIDLEEKTITINKQIQWVKAEKEHKKWFNENAEERHAHKCGDIGYWYLTPPKYNSTRVVDILDDHIVEVLKREKKKQEENKKKYDSLKGKVYDSNGNLQKVGYIEYYLADYDGKRVITNEKTDTPIHLLLVRQDGSYITRSSLNGFVDRIKKTTDISEFDFHSLRHTHTTDLCNMIYESGEDDTGKKISPVFVQKRLGHKSLQTTMDIYYHLTKEVRKKEAIKISGMYSDIF